MQGSAPDPFQLLDWIVSRHVHEYFDSAGRPVGEGRALVFRQVQTEMRICPYAGSRYRHAKPMNLTALQRMPPWPDVLTLLSWLSQRYRTRRNSEIVTSDDLAQVTGAGVFLADFLVLRSRLPLRSGEIPILISGLYKVCLGFQLAYLPERFDGSTELTRLPDPAGFLDYLEDNELLIGDEEVCSGAPAMVLQAYEAIVSHHPVALSELPPQCSALDIDWEQFDDFTDHAAALWRDLVRFAVAMPGYCPQLAVPSLPAEVRERINACLEQRGAQLLGEQTGLVADIARAALEFGNPAATRLARAEPAHPPQSALEPGSLTSIIVDWLRETAGVDMQSHEPLVASELQLQLALYDVHEAETVTGLNRHLSHVTNALGFGQTAPELTASALSRVLGGTFRDWRPAGSC